MGPNPAEVTAVVLARNAEQMLPRCLEALRQSGVAEIVVVDGCSTDSTVDLALAAGARVRSDEGRGHGWRGARLALLPTAAAVRGSVLSLAAGQPRWLRYYGAFCWYNYAGLAKGLAS